MRGKETTTWLLRIVAIKVVELSGLDVGNGGALVDNDALTLEGTLHRLGGGIHDKSLIPNHNRSNNSLFFTNLLIF